MDPLLAVVDPEVLHGTGGVVLLSCKGAKTKISPARQWPQRQMAELCLTMVEPFQSPQNHFRETNPVPLQAREKDQMEMPSPNDNMKTVDSSLAPAHEPLLQNRSRCLNAAQC